MVSISTRISEEEAVAFDAYVKQRSIAATGREGDLSGAAVLRALIRAAVESAGSHAPTPEIEAELPKGKRGSR